GLRDYGPMSEYHKAVRAHPDRPWTRQQFLDAVLTPGMLFAPGGSFAYSNVGYMLLIDIVERVTGQRFAEVVNDFLTRPLALQNTSVLEQIDDLMRCVPGFGSEVTSDGQVVDVRGRYHPGWCAPRLIASTAEDVTCVFDRLIAGDVLEPDTLRQMLTLAPLSDQPDEIHSGGVCVLAGRPTRTRPKQPSWGRRSRVRPRRHRLPRYAIWAGFDSGLREQQLWSASKRPRGDVARAVARPGRLM